VGDTGTVHHLYGRFATLKLRRDHGVLLRLI
jgi:hypothetical protein